MNFSWVFGPLLQYLMLLFLLKVQAPMMIQLDSTFICKNYILELFTIVQLLLTPLLPFHFISISYQLTIVWACTNPTTLLAASLNGGQGVTNCCQISYTLPEIPFEISEITEIPKSEIKAS